MDGIFGEEACAIVERAIESWDYGFGGVFACEACAGGVGAGVEDEGVYFICESSQLRVVNIGI